MNLCTTNSNPLNEFFSDFNFNFDLKGDVKEDLLDFDDRYEISLELPGVPKNAINVTFEKDILNVKAIRERAYDKSEVPRATSCRNYSDVNRSYKVPSAVDKEKIDAKCRNGILTVTLPKTAEVKPQKIKIT